MQHKTPELVVSLGASAGGLEPLEVFFKNMPEDNNMAFIVIQHLSPDYKSLMDEILGRFTTMAINRVEDSMVVEANNIYLIPAKKEMVIEGGKLMLRDKVQKKQLSMPVDIFFESLARDAGDKAVGIILSGSGSDGSRGVVDIKNMGGLVLVQEPRTAKFDSMPQSAIDSGAADLVIEIEKMCDALFQYRDNPEITKEKQPHLHSAGDEINGIVALLRDTYKIDFNLYKPGTIIRRIERRMGLKNYADIGSYLGLLHSDEGELNLLYKDLLIGVTSFFRDPEAFAVLENMVLPGLFAEDGNLEKRVWVVGCATGEEVYSLAIACSEYARQRKQRANLKFFATDVHRESLNFGAIGMYSKASLAGLSPDLLDRWFEKVGEESYQINAELRRMIVFAEHDVLKDPPFTKIDLLTCRNLLIYMQPAAQRKIISLFHFALNKGGRMFLGPSETLNDLEAEFEIIDKHWKIFAKTRDVRLPAHLRFPLASTLGTPNLVPARPTAGTLHIDQRLLRAYDSILEKHVSNGFLVNQYHELIHTFGQSRDLLRAPVGRASLDIHAMVEGELKIALAAALQRAERERQTVSYKGVNTKIIPGTSQISVLVDPLADKVSDSLYFFIVFQPQITAQTVKSDDQSFDFGEESNQRIHDLEHEIQNLRENLQATVEELETSNEELQASNEELVASNEELQSTNEELHSVNEELYTVNAEYEQKIHELTQMTNDLDNLLNSTAIGTIFLDDTFCIRKFTHAITEVFNVLPHDIGRPIDHISNTIDKKNIPTLLRQVMESGRVHEEEVINRNDRSYLMRILPYVTEQKRVEGIVVTFTDITSRKKAEDEKISLTEQLHHSHKMRALGTLAGGIAHEFNNLLQAISVQMELLSMNEDVPQEDRISLQEVLKMSNRAKDLVKGILTFSHQSSEKKGNVDLNEIIATTLKMLEKTLPRNIELQTGFDDQPVVINADSSQIQQILFNLATNSRDAMKDGGTLSFSTRRETINEEKMQEIPVMNPGDFAVLEVRDTGSGMSEEVADEIFHPFFTTKDIGKGTGIGLSIIYGIVSSHHGHIECTSSPGEGTTFTVYLPLIEGEELAETTKTAIPPLEPYKFEKMGGETVLIVDDEPSILKMCRLVLERSGLTVITASSGEEAVEIYKKQMDGIHLVVMDMGMPGMGGEKCIKELKKLNLQVKVVIASGYLNHQYAKEPELFGAIRFISKPYKVSELADQLRSVLAMK